MIQIPFDYLKKAGEQNIFITDAIVLYLIYNKEEKAYQDFIELPIISGVSIIDFLKAYEQLGLIKITGENLPGDVEFRKNWLNLLPASEKLDIDWVKEYLELWPQGVKSVGRYVRVSETDLETLLKKFVKKYKYSKEVILEATKKYIEEKRKVNWSYITCSDYFISKNNISMLASCCANLNSKITEGSQSEFSKEV
jgi:hypothetical protein